MHMFDEYAHIFVDMLLGRKRYEQYKGNLCEKKRVEKQI